VRGLESKAHEEGGDEVFARDISEHVSFSKTQVTHGTQTDPENIIENGQLGVRHHIFARFHMTSRKFIDALACDNA
jgi:hypothetical protein